MVKWNIFVKHNMRINPIKTRLIFILGPGSFQNSVAVVAMVMALLKIARLSFFFDVYNETLWRHITL